MKFFSYFSLVILATPFLTHAQIASSLLQFPQGNGTGFDAYINWLYVFSISIAALLAVVKIIIAGFKYITSDVISNKSEAKSDIKGALLGLLLILGAYVILNTINPNLVGGTINIDPVSTAPAVKVGGGGGVVPSNNPTPGNQTPSPNPSPSPLCQQGALFDENGVRCPSTPLGPNPVPPLTGNGAPAIPTICVPSVRTIEDTAARTITEFDFKDCTQSRSSAIKQERDTCNSKAVSGSVNASFSPRATHVYRCTVTRL